MTTDKPRPMKVYVDGLRYAQLIAEVAREGRAAPEGDAAIANAYARGFFAAVDTLASMLFRAHVNDPARHKFDSEIMEMLAKIEIDAKAPTDLP